MAGDWIAMRCNLGEDPGTIAIGLALKIPPTDVVGRLHRVWSWADQQSEDGGFRGIPLTFIDELARLEGFALAMVAVGWLKETRNGFLFPNFERWNTASGKARLQKTKRQQVWRKRADVDGHVDADVDGRASTTSDVLSSSSSSLEPSKTEDSQTDIRGGGPGVGGTADVLEQLAYQQPFLLGEVKAHAAMARLGLTVEDLEAWRRSGLPERKLIWGVQRFKRPEQMEDRSRRLQEEKLNDLTLIPDPDERKDKILKKRAAERQAFEEAAAKAAVPPPPELFEAMKRIGKKI